VSIAFIGKYHVMDMRKVLAIIGAIITGGLGITLLNTAQEASAALSMN
jgi:hypothetical protein